jgi:hypothetical protein
MKDENNGVIIIEFIGFKIKIYISKVMKNTKKTMIPAYNNANAVKISILKSKMVSVKNISN